MAFPTTAVPDGAKIYWWGQLQTQAIIQVGFTTTPSQQRSPLVLQLSNFWISPGEALIDLCHAKKNNRAMSEDETRYLFPGGNNSSGDTMMFLCHGTIAPGQALMLNMMFHWSNYWRISRYERNIRDSEQFVKFESGTLVVNQIPLQWVMTTASPLLLGIVHPGIATLDMSYNGEFLTRDSIRSKFLTQSIDTDRATGLIYWDAALLVSSTKLTKNLPSPLISSALMLEMTTEEVISKMQKTYGSNWFPSSGNSTNIPGSIVMCAWEQEEGSGLTCITIIHKIGRSCMVVVSSSHHAHRGDTPGICTSASEFRNLLWTQFIIDPNMILYVSVPNISKHHVRYALGIRHNSATCGCNPSDLYYSEIGDAASPSGYVGACFYQRELALESVDLVRMELARHLSAVEIFDSTTSGFGLTYTRSNSLLMLSRILNGGDETGVQDGLMARFVARNAFDKAVAVMQWISAFDAGKRFDDLIANSRKTKVLKSAKEKVLRAIHESVSNAFNAATVRFAIAPIGMEGMNLLIDSVYKIFGDVGIVDAVAGICAGCCAITDASLRSTSTIPTQWGKFVSVTLEMIEQRMEKKSTTHGGTPRIKIAILEQVELQRKWDCKRAPHACAEAGFFNVASALVPLIGFGIDTSGVNVAATTTTEQHGGNDSRSSFSIDLSILSTTLIGRKKLPAVIYGKMTSSQIVIPLIIEPLLWNIDLLEMVVTDRRIDRSILHLALAIAADSFLWEISQRSSGISGLPMTTKRTDLFSGVSGKPDYQYAPLEGFGTETQQQTQEFQAAQELPEWDYESNTPFIGKEYQKRVPIRPQAKPLASYATSSAQLPRTTSVKKVIPFNVESLMAMITQRNARFSLSHTTYSEAACSCILKSGLVTNVSSNVWWGGRTTLALFNIGISPPTEWWRTSPLAIFASCSLGTLMFEAASNGIATEANICTILSGEDISETESGSVLQLMASAGSHVFANFVMGVRHLREKEANYTATFLTRKELSKLFVPRSPLSDFPSGEVLITRLGVNSKEETFDAADMSMILRLSDVCSQWNCKLW